MTSIEPWWTTQPAPNLAAVAPTVARIAPDLVVTKRREGSEWLPVTAAEQAEEIERLAKGFVAAGVQPGDRVALMSKTRREWTLVDVALWTAGAIPVAVYDSSSADQLRWILEDSGAVGVVVEGKAGVRMAEGLRADLPALAHVWSIEEVPSAISLAELEASGAEVADEVLRLRTADTTREDVATLIYTSGTTGRPKGCMLTHDNLLREAELAIARLPELFDEPDACCLFFLPMAHVLGRIMEVAFLMSATTVGHSDPGRVTRDLATLRPTFTVAVPRIFERVYDGARRQAVKDGRGKVFDRAAQTAVRWSRAKQAGRVSNRTRQDPEQGSKGSSWEERGAATPPEARWPR